MGSLTYNFLNSSVLFHDDYINSRFNSLSDKRIELEVSKYHEYVLKNIDELDNEIFNVNHGIKIFSGSRTQTLNLLKQNALLVDAFIIQDPLFNFSPNRLIQSDIIGEFFGLHPNTIDRYQLAETCKFLKSITPLIAGNYVKIYPISAIAEKKWLGEFKMVSDYSRKVLPEAVVEFFSKLAKVRNLSQEVDGKLILHVDQVLELGRRIHVSFGEDEFANGMVYFLTQTYMKRDPNDENLIQVTQEIPDSLPTSEEFYAWVDQSIYSAAKNIFDTTKNQYSIAEKLDAVFTTDSKVRASLLGKRLEQNPSIEEFSIQTGLSFEMPYMDEINSTKLMDLRQFDPELFESFRINFADSFKELRTMKDSKDIKEKVENIQHDLFNVQVNQVDRKMKQFNKQFAATSTAMVGSVIAGIIFGPIVTVGGLILSGIKGYKDYNKWIEAGKQNPSYILWKSRNKQ